MAATTTLYKSSSCLKSGSTTSRLNPSSLVKPCPNPTRVSVLGKSRRHVVRKASIEMSQSNSTPSSVVVNSSSKQQKGPIIVIDNYDSFTYNLCQKVITNAVSLEKVNVAFVFGEKDFADVVALPKRNMVRDFFNSISGVSEMKISLYTIEFLDNNNRVYPSYDPLPQFCNVSTLKVTFSVSNLDRMMPTLLESFPKLKSLVLKLDYDPSRKRAVHVRFSSVPPCLLSSPEFVKIKCFIGGHVHMEVARYFLENSQVLKKLVLDFKCSVFEQGFYMLRDLLALPRRSSSCEILLC